jgi:hypothetical protein
MAPLEETPMEELIVRYDASTRLGLEGQRMVDVDDEGTASRPWSTVKLCDSVRGGGTY